MSLVETVTEFVAPKRKGRPPLPAGDASTASIVEAKVATARALLDQLVSQRNEAALAATLEEQPGEATARFEKLKADIASQERAIADLDAALQAARAADQKLLMQQQAALRRSEVNAIRKLIRDRDDAGRQVQIAIENLANAYCRMVETGEKAAHRLQALQGTSGLVKGAKLQPTELYKLTAHEMWRASTPFPKVYSSRDPQLPFDKQVVVTAFGREKARPMSDILAEQSASLIAELEGTG
jgi:hypothetical protein